MIIDEATGLSLSGQDIPTNEDITVIFTPTKDVVNYSYVLFKDGEEFDSIIVSSNVASSIVMTETGIYKLIISTKDSEGNNKEIVSDEYKLDKESPVLSVDSSLITIKENEFFDVLSGITAYDNLSGNLISEVSSNYEDIDFSVPGIKKLTYTVTDAAGNVATKTVNVNVLKDNTIPLVSIQITVAIILVVILIIINSFMRSVKLEKRISKYSIDSAKEDSYSLLERFQSLYLVSLSKISGVLSKSVFTKKYSKRFDKYVSIFDGVTSIDLVSTKFICGLLFLVIAICSKALHYQIMSFYEMIIPLLFGFFVPDIIYMSKYRIYRNKLENDLLQAIIIMNNAFKSGRSINQAVSMVASELNGPMAEEFKKMHLEMSFGLGIDVIFGRFAKRVNLEDANHLTASLSILNKTGGNIIKVFSSIEKSLFSKKRLKLELAALIGSSKMIMYVLFIVPLIFVVLVNIINPNYFLPFFTTPIGVVLLVFMLVYYVVYIVFIRKIMNVRM